MLSTQSGFYQSTNEVAEMNNNDFTTCQQCNTSFKIKNKHKANKYCSVICYRLSHKSGIYKQSPEKSIRKHNCSYCNNIVVRNKSKRRNGERSENVFCNRDCYELFRKKIIALEQVPCYVCKSMTRISKKYSRTYCSNACMLLGKKAKPKNCVNCKCLFTSIKLNVDGRLISNSAGKTCSSKCHIEWIKNNQARKDKISFAFSGSRHPNWQGGSHYMASRGNGWKKLRKQILERDDYKCVKCGMTEMQSNEVYSCGLHINHIKPFHQFGGKTKLANRHSNLESLCTSCHTKTDWLWRKENPVQYSLAEMFKK